MNRQIGPYDIQRVIGRGGMATVYLAHHRGLDRAVALKELALFDGAEPELVQRFLREARLAGSFSHPNIVTVHDFFEHGGVPYIAMEYLPRGALRPYVGRLSLAQIGGVLEGLLAGLAHAAESGVVHRDLKPENVMVTNQGRVKIADFGIAKARRTAHTETNLTLAGTTLGTPRYMAPERAMGQQIGPETDLYSVGMMAFELLVGRTPFHDTDVPMEILMRQINEDVPPVSSLVGDIDPALSEWVDRMLVKDPHARTHSAAEASDELDGVLTDVLGPRWLRAAALPATPGAAAAVIPPTRRLPDTAPTIAPAMQAAARPKRARLALPLLAAVSVAAVGIAVLPGHFTPPKNAAEVLPPVSTPSAEVVDAPAPTAPAQAVATAEPRAAAIKRAYDAAADAARREDGSDYDDALARARALENPERSSDSDENEPDENDNGD